MNLETLARETVNQYYDMNEKQRKFILQIINTKDIKWKRVELMKALLIFNKAEKMGCSVKDSKLDAFVIQVDAHSKTLNYLLEHFDKELRERVGVI